VSFNWDLVAERAFHNAKLPCVYTRQWKGPVAILKPHGSIHWSGFLREGLKSDYTGWVPTASNNRLSYDQFNPLGNPDMQEINPDLRYMIFPGDSESAEDPDLALIWNDVRAAIHSSEAVVFIGYSLPAYDSWSCRFFTEVCASKPVEVYNPDKTCAKTLSRDFWRGNKGAPTDVRAMSVPPGLAYVISAVPKNGHASK
jgi:hypothetical protein